MVGALRRWTDENEKKNMMFSCETQALIGQNSIHRLTHFLVVGTVVYTLNNWVQNT